MGRETSTMSRRKMVTEVSKLQVDIQGFRKRISFHDKEPYVVLAKASKEENEVEETMER